MRKFLLLLSAALVLNACKDSSTDANSNTGGCGDGRNPDSLTRFVVRGSQFREIRWDSVWHGSTSLMSKFGKDGVLRYTLARGFSERSSDTTIVIALTFPKWETGAYNWSQTSASNLGVGAQLYYYWTDPKTYELAHHDYYSISGGSTVSVKGRFFPGDTTVLLGTFCGKLKDSLGHEIAIEDGLIHFAGEF